MLSAQGKIRNPGGNYAWAITKIQQRRYRKEFGLSFKEFREEPLNEYLVNLEIMNIENQIDDIRAKQAERKAKM